MTSDERMAQLLAECAVIEQAIQLAVRDALLMHKRLGLPIVSWENGQVVWIPPEQIEVEGGPDGECASPDRETVLKLLHSGQRFAALEAIQGQGTPLEIAERYDALVRELYWKEHDLPAVVTIGRMGIIHCMGAALADTDPAASQKLRDFAKRMAYNVGSFTWPGWEEPGIDPTAEELSFGRECAQLNLRLAHQLERPPKGVSAAHWLIGAHALATGQFELARQEFERAQLVLAKGDPVAAELEPLNVGYLAIARLCATPSDAANPQRFDEVTAGLAARSDDDAKVYLSQLVAARRLFVPGQLS